MPNRTVSTDIWSDDDVIDKFTAEDRYFWLYLLTSPFVNLCGVMLKRTAAIARDTGFNDETVERLLNRFQTYLKKIYVSAETKEIVILNWHKYNWNKSPLLIKSIETQAAGIKSAKISSYIYEKIECFKSENARAADTASLKADEPTEKPRAAVKHKYGTYGWIRLTDEQYKSLREEYGEEYLEKAIKGLDEYVQGNGNKNEYKDWNLTLRKAIRNKWSCVCDRPTAIKPSSARNFNEREYSKADLNTMFSDIHNLDDIDI